MSELEPQPRDLDTIMSSVVTELLAEHAAFSYESQPQPTLFGNDLLLRAQSGRFYRVLRVTRLSHDGAKAMDSLSRTHPGGHRYLHKDESQMIRREYGDIDDTTGTLLLTSLNTIEGTVHTPLTESVLDEWIEELRTAEPMEYQVGYEE